MGCDETIPQFQLGKPMYDQRTYKGRLYHFLNLIDPRTLITTEAQLQYSIDLLDKYEKGVIPTGITNSDLWAAQKIKQSVLHPDTGQKILMPLRMSGYVPFGTPVVVGLLLPNPTLKATIIWQWLNQSHNAFFNYANRNATKPTPTSRFVLGYIGAVGSAVGIAVGLNVGLAKMQRFSPATRSLVQRFIPYPAVACANICNVMLMRNSELSSGVDVYERDGNVVGTSQVAALKAVQLTAFTRVILPLPILVLPPIAMSLLERTKFLRNNPRWNLPIHSLAVLMAFGGALPAVIALFPQEAKIATKHLEDRIRSNTQEEYLYFNKGV